MKFQSSSALVCLLALIQVNTVFGIPASPDAVAPTTEKDAVAQSGKGNVVKETINKLKTASDNALKAAEAWAKMAADLKPTILEKEAQLNNLDKSIAEKRRGLDKANSNLNKAKKLEGKQNKSVKKIKEQKENSNDKNASASKSTQNEIKNREAEANAKVDEADKERIIANAELELAKKIQEKRAAQELVQTS